MSQKGGKAVLFSNIDPPRFTGVTRYDNAPYKFQQMVSFGSYTSSTGGGTAWTSNFELSQVDQSADFTAIFDQYRIKEVEWWFIPRMSVSQSGTANTGNIVSVVDYDDDTTLPNLTTGLDYQNALLSAGTTGHYRRFVPHAAIAAFSGSFTSYVNATSPWIDAASPGVRHYGIKAYWTATDVVYTIDCFARIHFEFRNVR